MQDDKGEEGSGDHEISTEEVEDDGEQPDSPMIPPTKTQHQIDVENEWELHRPATKTRHVVESQDSETESIDWRRAKEAGFDEDVGRDLAFLLVNTLTVGRE